MQQQYLFEYAIVRLVPQVEREEFLNVGVVIYCPKQKYLQMKFSLNSERLRIFSCDMDVEVLRAYLDGFARICSGDAAAGTIAKLPIAERFRWLTSTRSTVLQTSKVHPGFCEDAGETMMKIFTQLVL